MSKRTIVICDDERSRVAEWKRRLEACPPVRRGFTVAGMTDTELLEAVGDLEKRRGEARKHGVAPRALRDERFDDVGILAVDFDLLKLNPKMFLTAEAIAYLVRCYSGCGLIVALNQYGDDTFDLTLRGHPESYADINIGGAQLDSPGLWTEPWKGFRPWAWPILPAALDAFEKRVEEVRANLEKPVLEFLGLADAIPRLPHSAIEFIDGRSKTKPGTVPGTTFRQFVTLSGNGLRGKDRPFSEEGMARIAAARVWKWLERLVFGGQDVIVDAPHLVSRYPSLLKGNPAKIETWNGTVSLRGVPKALRREKVEKYRFKKEHWLSRPAWFWQEVSKSEGIAEVSRPFEASRRSSDCVFCEDVSKFLPRASAREFIAELASPFVRRFVADPASPAARRIAPHLKHIKYRPEIRFSL